MINYNRLEYEIKRDLTKFRLKISQNLKRLQKKFAQQTNYGILAGNKLHLSENARLRINRCLSGTIYPL